MSKLYDLIKELCPSGVEYKALGDIATLVRGNGLPKSDFTDTGVGCIHYGQIYTYYGISTYETKSFVSQQTAEKLKKVEQNDVIITNTSENLEDVCKAVAWLGTETIVTGGHATIIKGLMNPKYFVYYTQTKEFYNSKQKYATGAKVIDVSANNLAKIQIPLPPLPVQEEIVRILDNFTELTAEVTAELTARKKQYEYYRDSLLVFGDEVEWKPLGEVGEVRMCKRILKEQTSDTGDIPFFKIGTFGKEPNAYISQDVFDEYKEKYNYPKVGEILLSASGTIGRTVIFDGKDAYFQDSNIVWIENNETNVLNKYLFYCYQIVKWNISEGGTIQRLYNDNLKKTLIPIPYPNDIEKSLAEQQRIVNILDRFDTLCNDISSGLPAEIKMRQQQYEYYRDKLLTFERLER